MTDLYWPYFRIYYLTASSVLLCVKGKVIQLIEFLIIIDKNYKLGDAYCNVVSLASKTIVK